MSALGASDSGRFWFVAFIVKHTVTVVTHSIPSIMRSVTASLRTLGHDDKVTYYAFIWCMLNLVPKSISDFMERVLYSVEVEVEDVVVVVVMVEGLMTGGVIRIIIYGLSNINFYTVRLISLLLSIVCCFILIWNSLYREITPPFTWAWLSLCGYFLLHILYKSSLIPINMRSSMVIRYIHHYCFIPITRSRRSGIYLRFSCILFVILMFSTALIRCICLTPCSQIMLSIVFIFLKFKLQARCVSFFYNRGYWVRVVRLH